MRRHRNTKIVATLGPASSSREIVRALFDAGADVFRLNFSHGEHADHKARFDVIRALEQEVPFVEEVEACLPKLWKEIAKAKPKVIVPVGGTAIAIFTGVKTVSRVRGQKREFEFDTGKKKIKIPVVATYQGSTLASKRR